MSLSFAKQTVQFVRQGHPLCKRVGLKVPKRWSNSQDALGQPFLVPLTQPGLRARTKAARNNLAAAREAAEKGAPNPSTCRLTLAARAVLGSNKCAGSIRGCAGMLLGTRFKKAFP